MDYLTSERMMKYSGWDHTLYSGNVLPEFYLYDYKMGAGRVGMCTGGTGKNFSWGDAWETLSVVWKTGNIVINITD